MKIGLIVLAVLVGLPVVLCLAIAWTVPDDQLLLITLGQLRAATGLDLRARHLELHLLEGLVLTGVRLEPPAGFRDPPLEVERVIVGYAPGELLEGRLRLRSLRLERPRIRLQHDGARTNLAALLSDLRRPAAAAPEAEGGGFGVMLEQGELRDLALEISLPGLRAELEGLSVDVTASLGSAGERALEAKVHLPPPTGRNLHAGEGLDAGVALDAEARWGAAGGAARLEAEVAADALGEHRLRVVAAATLPPDASEVGLAELRLLLDAAQVLEATGALSELSGRRAFHLTIAQAALLEPGTPGLASLVPGLPDLSGRVTLEGVEVDGALDGSLPRLKGTLGLRGVGARLAPIDVSDLRGGLEFAFEPGDGRDPAGSGLRLQGTLRAAGLGAGALRLERLRGEVGFTAGLERRPDGLALREPRLTWSGSAEQLRARELQSGGLALQIHAAAPRAELGPGGLEVAGAEVVLDGSCRSTSLAARGDPAGSVQLGLLELHGSAQAGALAMASAAPLLVDRLAGRLGLHAQRLRQGVLQVDDLGLELTAQAGGLLGRGKAPGLVEIQARCGPLTRGPLRLARAEVGLRLPLTSLRPREIPLHLTARAEALAWEREGLAPIAAPAAVTLDADSDLRLGALRVRVERAALGLGGLLDLTLSGEYEAATRAIRAELRTAPHRLEALVAGLPEDFRAPIPRLTGEVQLEGWFRGSLPEQGLDIRNPPVEGEVTIRHRDLALELPVAGLRLAGVSGPARLHVGGAGEPPARGSFELRAEQLQLASPALTARGLSIAVSSSWNGEEIIADGKSTAERVETAGLWPEPVADAQLEAALLVSGLKEVRLTEFELNLGSVGLTLSGEGQVVRPPEASELSELRLDLRTRLGLASEKPVRLPGGLHAAGRAEAELAVKSVQPGVLRAEGKVVFGGLDLVAGGFALRGAAGAVPVSQLVALRPALGLLLQRSGGGGELRGTARDQRSAAYEQALRPLKGEERSFLIRELTLHDLRFSELSGNLELSGGTLGLNGLRFRFLDGDFLADTSVTLAPPGTRRLALDAEMSGVELAQLPQLAALALGGPSDVSGNLRLAVDLNQDDVGASFNLTQIGRDTLQALLLAIDPGQANPGVQELRRYLDSFDVSPRQVAVNIRHGLLSMRVEFELGLVARAAARFLRGFQGDAFEISHLPVGDFLAKYMKL